MEAALLSATEDDRLAALHSYKILDTARDEAFDDLVALVARLTGTPIALVSLIDRDRQWFKARLGLDVAETHRDFAFCAHAILDPENPLIVPDTATDPRFEGNPLVTGAPNIRSYLGVPLVNPEGHALGTLCVIDRVPRDYDVTVVETVRTLSRAVTANLELRRTLLRAHAAALTDPLTSLPNRRGAMEALAAVAQTAEPVAIIVVDLDHFKEVNDGEGHAAGDALLEATARRLRRAIRPGDLASRIGGDEFMVMLHCIRRRDDVAEFAERISVLLHRPVDYGDRMLRLGATLGVALVPDDVAEPETAMRLADQALMHAKRTGRGGIAFASQEDAKQLARSAAIIRSFDHDTTGLEPLHGAIVHFQPILALTGTLEASPKVVAVEALTRWRHPAVGSVPPAELFAVIGPERTAQLGHFTRAQALMSFAALHRNGLAGARLALNLSASEVCRLDIAQSIAKQVEQAGLTLRHIEVEITEEVLFDRVSDDRLDQLASLRDRGARLMLDDFGTGNSGLAQLLRLPLDGIKLDKQFVQRLGQDIRADEIVRASISLAHGLGLQVVAEGIETEQQAAILLSLDCDAVQGFMYARPMGPAALKRWLRERALSIDPSLAPTP